VSPQQTPSDYPRAGRVGEAFHRRSPSKRANSRFGLDPSQPFSSRNRVRSQVQSEQPRQTLEKRSQTKPIGLSHYLSARWAQNRENEANEVKSHVINDLEGKNGRFSGFLDETGASHQQMGARRGPRRPWAETNCMSYLQDSMALHSISRERTAWPKRMIWQGLILRIRIYSFVPINNSLDRFPSMLDLTSDA
jgi:hypothetical protein